MTLDDLLGRFGTDKARQNFLELCCAYFGERSSQEAAETAGTQVPATRRAEIHTEIMTVVQKLYLRENGRMPSRPEVGGLIMEHFREETPA